MQFYSDGIGAMALFTNLRNYIDQYHDQYIYAVSQYGEHILLNRAKRDA